MTAMVTIIVPVRDPRRATATCAVPRGEEARLIALVDDADGTTIGLDQPPTSSVG